VTRYARAADGVHIAYQVFGEGPVDVVFVWGVFSHVELVWEHEAPAHYLRRLASFSRVIHFDKRGTGLSDRPERLPSLEEQMDDVIAVMDAVGAERVVMLAGGDSGLLAILFAAAHPERTAALVLSGSRPRITSAPGFAWGPPPEEWHDLVASLAGEWGTGITQVVAPSQEDPVSQAWWARLERYSLSPGAVAQLWEVIEQTDVRSVLPSVHVPALVLHRGDDPFADVAAGRYVAGHIAGARFVEITGTDHPGWGSGADTELDEIEDFLTGTHAGPHSGRVLATVLFTDIVDSTQHASAAGDRRWRQFLADHEAISRSELGRHRGHWVKSTGDGILATFDGPARAIRCAQAIAARMHQLGLPIRAGIHTGECEQIGQDVGGVAVHTAARVAALARADQVLVSRTVVDLVAGSGLSFTDQGEHALKGIPGTWQLFTVTE
jgi:class 3 adenylate cyclase